ncbi:D-3-phosphoglycerate dehydrogenase [Pleurostoma richardsiae]|uniref:D-3-phosphoglycerate dehydrogenase n=1 Tax=Pleurostoma richardsiae TaxID=41990 RepID=A0AA38R4A1_9PEZI|nr:D-3-phosphoglycerate dehydrogenase [Pleurostoma richardsiae]
MAPSATSTDFVTSAAASNRLKVLVPETLSPDGLALLEQHFDVDTRAGLSPEDLISLVANYHALIVRSATRVTAAVLAAARNLRVVARAGVGIDNIDVDAATQRGIVVVNSPAGNVVAAAEHTVALLLAVARNVSQGDAGVKDGRWDRSGLVGVEVGRKTLGVVGLGKVGLKVARTTAAGLGMKVLAVDPYASAEIAAQAGVKMVSGLDELLPSVDFLTIHTPLLASTLDLLGEKEFKMMKSSARVLNVARGGVYNEEALLRALDEGWIAGAGIDVFTAEPPTPGSAAARLAAHPKVVATPHLGASTVEAQENVSLDVCAQVLEILQGGLPTSAVNAPLILPEEYRKLQPFVRLIERMGGLYTQHFGGSKGGMVGGRRFELVYQGELASISNTRPLFAALVRGLLSPISDAGGRDVNMVNAALIAKDKGLAVDEIRASDRDGLTYASQVTLRSHNGDAANEQVIEGYVSGRCVYISKLDRFAANFTPEGTLVLLHNYDEPGKIGDVGTVLGRHGINIRFMHVASLDLGQANGESRLQEAKNVHGGNEALMILGVAGEVTKGVLDDLARSDGILDVSLVRL